MRLFMCASVISPTNKARAHSHNKVCIKRSPLPYHWLAPAFRMHLIFERCHSPDRASSIIGRTFGFVHASFNPHIQNRMSTLDFPSMATCSTCQPAGMWSHGTLAHENEPGCSNCARIILGIQKYCNCPAALHSQATISDDIFSRVVSEPHVCDLGRVTHLVR